MERPLAVAYGGLNMSEDKPYDVGDPKVIADVTLRLVMSLGQCTEEKARKMIAAYENDEFEAYQVLTSEP